MSHVLMSYVLMPCAPIARREHDNIPVMRYKPCAAHQHLYPTLKDPETRMPLYDMVNGETQYKTDINGIEVFTQLPTGTPAVQPFENNQLDLKEICFTMQQIVAAHPCIFSETCGEWWKSWTESTPTTKEEVIIEQLGMLFEWPAKAGEWHPAHTRRALESEYRETVTYVNTQAHYILPVMYPMHLMHHTHVCTPRRGLQRLTSSRQCRQLQKRIHHVLR